MKSFTFHKKASSQSKKFLKHSKTTIKGLIGGKFTLKWANSKPNFETQNQKILIFFEGKKVLYLVCTTVLHNLAALANLHF